MTALIFIFAGAYLFLLLYYLNGWYSLEVFIPGNSPPKLKFSIIIPARNEEACIQDVLEDLISQDYPVDLFEIIVVDDASKDSTARLIREFQKENKSRFSNLTYILLSTDQANLSGKKAAITKGVEASVHKWIVCTDADCRINSTWLSTLASFIEKQKPVFVSAPVVFHNETTYFEKMQSLEFMSLIGIGAATISQGSPTMSNGANMAFKREVFAEVNGYSGNEHIASGDDEFLMHKIARTHPGRIKFLKSAEAMVRTRAKVSLDKFWEQRKRWVSKSRNYKNPMERGMQVFVWLFHLILLISLVVALFIPQVWTEFLLLFAIKIVAELVFVFPLAKFFKKQEFLIYYIPAAFLYIFYVVFVAFAGSFGKFYWKGRRIN
ncbi:glycosyltransferase [Bacteroidota bacterium]